MRNTDEKSGSSCKRELQKSKFTKAVLETCCNLVGGVLGFDNIIKKQSMREELYIVVFYDLFLVVF